MHGWQEAEGRAGWWAGFCEWGRGCCEWDAGAASGTRVLRVWHRVLLVEEGLL